MTEQHEETVVAPAEPPAPEIRPRIWPALAIAVLYACLYSVAIITPTIILNFIGVVAAPLLSTLLLAVWWFFFSRVPWRDRAAGIAIAAATLVWLVLSQPRDGGRILLIALPALLIGFVALLIVTHPVVWQRRRWILLAAPLGCAIVFPMFRIADLGSNLAPILTWRWTPSPEDRVATAHHAQPDATGKAELPAQPGPHDWPGFRGPRRDGIVMGVRFATNWNENPPRELWRKPVGLGFSSFAAVGNYIFTIEQRHEDEVIVCYQADNGDEIWISASKARFEDPTGSGPRSTPVFDNGRLYCMGTLGLLRCLDAATGAIVWEKDAALDTAAKLPEWGFASSPLITEKHVIVFTGGPDGQSTAAYDKVTGERVWCGGNGNHGYASAHLALIGGVSQIVMVSGFGVESFTPDTGKLLWTHEWPTRMNPRVVQPLVVDAQSLLIGTAEEKGTRSLQINRNGDTWDVREEWTTKAFRPYFNDFTFHKGYCYGFDGDQLKCIDAHTGLQRWKGKRFGGQVLLIADMDALVVLSEKGDVILAKADPNGFEEIAQFKAIKGKTWNHPVIANGKLFVRNGAEAACFELPAS